MLLRHRASSETGRSAPGYRRQLCLTAARRATIAGSHAPSRRKPEPPDQISYGKRQWA